MMTHPEVGNLMLRDLMALHATSWRFDPVVGATFMDLYAKVQYQGGIDSLTPVELAWLANLIADTRSAMRATNARFPIGGTIL